ncbi:MAG: mechanosensitive ion channel, partial [Acaryochloridaceae cyanobacterium SU_2_1]|nr:mechanosensitive ion channel [Acaryochloridaceae cyanobacterium SU_2_1]
MLFLSEVIVRLQKQGKPLASTLLILRNLVLPMFVLFIVLTRILGLEAEQTSIRLIQTLLWVSLIHTALSLVNVLLFVEAERQTWQAQVPKLLRDLTRFFLILIGTAFVLSLVWKTNLGGLLTALGVSSIVLGLALQDTLGNLFSGIALLFGRPFVIGDWLKFGDQVGKVIEINWRAVHLITRNHEMLIVPNSVLAKEVFYNYRRPQPIHVEPVEVGFSYNNPPNQVKQVLKAVALNTPGVLSKPEPVIQTLNYADSTIHYRIRLFIRDYERVPEIRDAFMTRIWYAAQRHHLVIPFPIRTLIHERTPLNPGGDLEQRVEELRSLPCFMAVQTEILAQLAYQAKFKSFGQGERIIQQGQTQVDLHFLLSGQVQILVEDSLKSTQNLLLITKGEFFGAMSLLSQE